MNVVGLDIGGANIKAADLNGQTVATPFAVWQRPDELADCLAQIIARFTSAQLIAVTMTAELADCFTTKTAGVHRILDSVESAAGRTPIRVWQTGAEFVDSQTAREIPMLVAAANWHAQATWLGRIVPTGKSILVDIGTTTTDIIPLIDGLPVSDGLTDPERLASGELVYSGVRRTPLCALAHAVPMGDGYCSLAAELFATTLDVYLMLGDIPESTADRSTANGRPATIECAHDRLARMLCCDRDEFSAADALHMSRFLADVQRQRIAGAARRVITRLANTGPGEINQVLMSGSGEFLARRIVLADTHLQTAEPTSLAAIFNAQTATAACAVAVAKLAAERVVL
jgi:probable H4MPT-linked C1 transfer pathway protein